MCCVVQPIPSVPDPVDPEEEAQLDRELQELRDQVQQVRTPWLGFRLRRARGKRKQQSDVQQCRRNGQAHKQHLTSKCASISSSQG